MFLVLLRLYEAFRVWHESSGWWRFYGNYFKKLNFEFFLMSYIIIIIILYLHENEIVPLIIFCLSAFCFILSYTYIFIFNTVFWKGLGTLTFVDISLFFYNFIYHQAFVNSFVIFDFLFFCSFLFLFKQENKSFLFQCFTIIS